MGFVTLASFDDTLSISQKENAKNSFLLWEISCRTAVSFLMVCSVKMSISLNQENISEGLLNSDFKSGMAVISGVG